MPHWSVSTCRCTHPPGWPNRFWPRSKNSIPQAHICFFGSYAPLNDKHLRSLSADTILGGEFESGLVDLYAEVVQAGQRPARQSLPWISLARQAFITLDRAGLPPLEQYAQLVVPGATTRVVGYTEASRGCRAPLSALRDRSRL